MVLIEGLTVDQFRALPTVERAGLFMERYLEYARNHLTDPQELRRVRDIAHLTVDIIHW